MEYFLGNLEAAVINWIFIALPLLILALSRKSVNPLIALALFSGAFFFDVIVLTLPRALFDSPFQWNWVGKAGEFAWPLAIVFIFGWMNAEEVGLKLPKIRSNLWLGALLGLLFALYNILSFFLEDGEIPYEKVNLETILYQFTMPGLGEEIIFRGIIFVIFNRFLGRQWKLFNIEFGWGLIFVSVLFVLVHIIHYSPQQKEIVTILNPQVVAEYCAISFTMGFLRQKSGSIWPSVILHNLTNSLPIIFLYLIK